jgi:hypothetical protein
MTGGAPRGAGGSRSDDAPEATRVYSAPTKKMRAE